MRVESVLEKFITIDGAQIYTKTWRPSSILRSTPVVLIHESLGCVEMWKDFAEDLSQETGRVVVAYDRVGYGRSSAKTQPPSGKFVEEEAKAYLPLVLEELGIKQVVLFGHSVGGSIAIIAAGILKSRCKAVISESAQAFIEQRTIDGILKAKEHFKIPVNYAKLHHYHQEKTDWVLNAWTSLWLSPGFANWNLFNALPQMECPALIIHGENDEYGSTQFPDKICELAGGATEEHIVAQCGHLPHREQPELVLGWTKKFLDELD